MADPFLFPQTLAGLETISAVCAELLRHTVPLGFAHYAIGAIPHPQSPYPADFVFQNWPVEWSEAYFQRRFGERDPVLRALTSLGTPVTSEDLRCGILGPLSPGETEVLATADAMGIVHGLYVPVFRAQGYQGIAGKGPDPAPATRALLQYLLGHTHDRLRSLYARGARTGVSLTHREIHVLSLCRRGLTDAVIAAETGISVRTVRFHLDNARRKLGAHNRAEALSQAIARHLLPL